jgi:ATP-binding cassette subfamily F protein uup
MVVLDEPTNHLDLEAIEWLESRLVKMKSALVLVTHDRHALDRLTTAVGPSKVVELDAGRCFVHQAAAGSSAYATYLDARAERIDREAHEESTRKILARKELAWLRRGAPARSTKPKARLRTANEIVSGGPAPVGVRGSELQLGGGTARLGNQVVELEDVAQRFNVGTSDELTVFEHVDLLIEPGARLAVVGPNGSGKSTLLDIIAGRTEPADGTVKRGKTVVVGFADQHSSDLDPDAVVRELVAGPHREPDFRDRALLERFWFDTTAQYAPVRMLSGGERRRLQLVMVLATEPNLLILDEPTNDLDLDTLRSLEAFLDDWPGALVVASHDRAFLDRVADHVLAIDPGGSVRRVAGGVAGWLAERSSPSAPAVSARATKATASPAPKAKSGPSPYTVGRQLRETEQAMVKAQKRVDQLTEQLASVTDHTELTTLGNELASAQEQLDELESRWLELAELQST